MYGALDRIANVVPVLAWAVLPGGGPNLSSHVGAGLFALLLLHVAARVGLALAVGQVRAQFLPASAAAARSLVGGSVTWLALLVVFGAPLAAAHSETLLFAVLLSCWTVWPAALAFGVSFEQWIAFFLASDASSAAVAAPAVPVADAALLARSLVRRAYATAVGCWLGALVIPLDWDRPWQAWPVPCVYGALAGHVVGSLLL